MILDVTGNCDMTDPLHFLWRRLIWPYWNRLRSDCNVRSARANYARLVTKKYGLTRKSIRVIFLVNESSKWKYDALFKALDDNPNYYPVVCLTCADIDWHLDIKAKISKLESNESFFRRRGIRCEMAYDYQLDKTISLDRFKPDVVFYQHPWGIASNQCPLAVSKYALTYYVPYFLPTYGLPEECRLFFHRCIFRHIVLNQDWANYYSECQGKDLYAGKMLPLGHPILDVYWQKIRSHTVPPEGVVIYAPHWSMPHPKINNVMNISTFLDTDRPMLKYARNHPEIKWVFKPHPSLKTVLYKIWPSQDVDDYYAQWEQLGRACYTGDYIDLFFESSALITDCDSFLVEYAFTGNPVIHLKRNGYNLNSKSPFVKLFNTYYGVTDVSQIAKVIDYVVLKHNDPNKQLRTDVMNCLCLYRHDIASAIMHDLDIFFAQDAAMQ